MEMDLGIIFENFSSTYIFCVVTTFLSVAIAIYTTIKEKDLEEDEVSCLWQNDIVF